MGDTDIVGFSSASEAPTAIERLDPVEGALLRLEDKLDAIADHFCVAMDDMKRSVIRTIVAVAVLQTVAYTALLYFL